MTNADGRYAVVLALALGCSATETPKADLALDTALDGGPGGTPSGAGGSDSGPTVDDPGAGEGGAIVPPPHIACTGCAGVWSSPQTWGGTPPGDGDLVTIPAGTRIVLDQDTPTLAGLTVQGELELGEADVTLTAGWVLVTGVLRAGTESAPFTHHATFRLTGSDPEESIMGMGTRGILVVGGTLSLHGATPASVSTKLAASAEAGATTIEVLDATGWSAGDEIALAPTDFYRQGETERMTVAGLDGTQMTLDGGLETARWGVLQYVTTTGISLEAGTEPTPPATPTPLVLDERAEVVHLSRRITIEAPDDDLWQNDGFGAHVMVMDLASQIEIVGVALRRVGQRGHLARYPVHFHRLSYDDTGAELGDATGDRVERSTVVGSTNRCIVIHGTNGVTLRQNACVGVEGHAIFLEDAVERRNVIEENVVLGVRFPQVPLKIHDADGPAGGASGFWLTHPDNVVRGNVAADSPGSGFWLSYPTKPTGPSASVPVNPSIASFGVFDDNVAHSNGFYGVNLDWAVVDEDGNVEALRYSPTVDDVPDRYDNWERFALNRLTTYKNRQGGIWSRTTWPDYFEFVSADNQGTAFAGAGFNGLITRALVVGESLNVGAGRPDASRPPVAFASYHSTFDMRENVVAEFPLVVGLPSGTFRTDDYYIRPVDKGPVRNPDNLLINSHPGFRSPAELPSFALAGALWDPHGYFGPAGRYWTYDDPFLTWDATCTPVDPAGSNGSSCDGPYYGVLGFVLDRANDSWAGTMAIQVARLDGTGTEVGTWVVETGGDKLGNMRHFAALRGGRYLLAFPDGPPPGEVTLTIENAPGMDDNFVLGISRQGGSAARVYATTSGDTVSVEADPPSATKEIYAAVGSVDEVGASSGATFWEDTTAGIVWVKIRGGLDEVYVESTDPVSDEQLYRPMYLRVY